jgi:ubiquinone/menaquinone biosynthesis C-methylase UbiE
MWGREMAEDLVREAGFRPIGIHELPNKIPKLLRCQLSLATTRRPGPNTWRSRDRFHRREVIMKELETAVASHYGKAGLLEVILAALENAGADPDNLQPVDLAPVDEFHTAGRLTTLKALKMMPLKAGMHVLDAGCGLGGTARVLAKEYGCRVTGIDLTPQYVEIARALTGRMQLAEQCAYHVGSVTRMPFPDAEFDAAVSFHVAMNISERDRFYAELARVMRSGAPLCVFDVMKGPSSGMIYPVPWAETEETSFLISPAGTRDLLRAQGFDIEQEESVREFAIQYFREAFAKAAKADGPPPLGLHLLTGANAPEKFANYAKALDEHQIDPVIIVARKN